MSARPKILYLGQRNATQGDQDAWLSDACDLVPVSSASEAISLLAREEYAGIYVAATQMQQVLAVGQVLENDRILQGMPDGVVLIDAENKILWGNGRLRQWVNRDSLVGENFYTILGSPEILGPDFCPFHTALATGHPSSSTLRSTENSYYRVHAAPVLENDGSPPKHLIVTIRDVTAEVLQQQKLAAIHQAGVELADLSPDELSLMSVEERIDLLKQNILHYTQDLLNFDVVEVRLLDKETSKLEPLLSEGMTEDAANRELFADRQSNGVTGFVAATGKSYMCEDTTEDPLYLEGAQDAKSSLTVPLVLHDEVIGTFNVESPEPRAFTESDLQFLEIFSRAVAASLNTLELLVAEKASTAAESVEAIHSAVAKPVDDILNDAVNIMERYIGHEPDVTERLQRILRNTRDIKQVIQKVGQKMAPSQAHPQGMQVSDRPHLRGLQVLVADADESVRSAAHSLLERYGCVVETAHDGGEAIFMVRSLTPGDGYDVIIADIRLPDMSGYDFLLKLKTMLEPPPLVLMTGFGYDPGHSIVKARQAGLQCVLYKPFRLDQLLDAVETVTRACKPVRQP